MTLLQRFRRSDAGQAIVEVAIVAPFLLILLVSVIDVGRLNHYRTIVGNSARAGAAYGSENLTTVADAAGIRQAAQNDAANSGRALSGLTVTPTTVCKCSDGSPAVCSPPTTCPANTHLITYSYVLASYPFTTLFDYHVIRKTMTITRTAVMEVAQ